MNDTDNHYPSTVVEVQLSLPGQSVHLSESEAEEELDPPEEPAQWGRQLLSVVTPIAVRPRVDPAKEQLPDSTTLVRFPPLDVRPRTTHPLSELLLTLGPEWQDQELKIQWRATSTTTKGDLTGELVTRVQSWPEHVAKLPARGESA